MCSLSSWRELAFCVGEPRWENKGMECPRATNYMLRIGMLKDISSYTNFYKEKTNLTGPYVWRYTRNIDF